MRGRWIRSLAAGVMLLGALSPARGDIYMFVDPAGVTHLSNVPNDPRYRLLVADPRTAPAPQPGKWLANSRLYDPLIERAARGAALAPELVRAVIAVESAFNPQAVSRRGALGLMQLRPATARRYGVANAFDPAQNIAGGTQYLRDLMQRYGNNMELALAAYNAGEDAVERYGRTVPPFSETRQYVPAVLRVYHALLARARS
ncbi:MAG: lytic transglycosylase domain-containing protein [Gammaproteobacteria bacterium]|nr:lytic transglycosylase domain-containing protein [Gammaproteobacteria bacterium]